MSALRSAFVALAFLFSLASFPPARAYAEEATQALSSAEKLELEIYRKTTPDLRTRVEEAEANLKEMGGDQSQYIASAYKQRAALGELAVKAFEWQLFASNIILALVVILTVAGISLGTYQLIIATKMALIVLKEPRETMPSASPEVSILSTTVELSPNKMSLQTSVVGFFVLLASGFFLLMFLQYVYPVRDVSQRLSALTASSSPASRPR